MNYLINRFISDDVVQAISWALLHSLWQGLIAALLALAVIVFTRNTRAATRYNLLLIIFGLQIAAAGFTFFMLLSGKVNNTVASNAPLPAQPAATITEATGDVLQTGFIDRNFHYINDYAPLIVSLWFFVILVMLTKMIVDLAYVQKLRTRNVFEPGEMWKEAVTRISSELRLSRPVILLQSALAKTPIVVGYFKPVILIPFSVLSNFSPAQVEAILRHELAHIKRNDYIVNMLQSIAEIIFFFNPAVWWISSLIRDEREHCCDELAISGGMNKRVFVEALLSFQEYQVAGSYAQTFAGPRYKMLNRVQRIFRLNNKPAYPITKIILTTCIVMTVAAVSTFADLHQQKKAVKQQPVPRSNNDVALIENNSPVNDTTPVEKPSMNDELKKEAKEAVVVVEDTMQAIPYASEKLIPSILDDFEKDKLITDRENATFIISPDKMIVNWQQQPAEVHLKYKKKYLREPDITLEYDPQKPHPNSYGL